ncbi:MAG: response regulator transcription factor, partial [Pseudomonas sp.]|nr:response regulator transcription factor [Pseudomonas sp.]
LEFLLSTVEEFNVIESFANGASFISYLSENQAPDIVLLDLVMPEMNGIEVTEFLKKNYSDIKVLVLTSYVDDEHVISAINKGGPRSFRSSNHDN